MILSLLRRYPQQQFYLKAAPKYAKPFKDEPNLNLCGSAGFTVSRCIGKFSGKALRRIEDVKTAKCSATVRIGGSVFIERENASELYYPEKHENCFYIGSNFGPYHSREFYETRKERIKGARDCCFRDSYSYGLFRELRSTRLAPDILFGYPLLPALQQGDCVGISIMDFSNRKNLVSVAHTYEKGIAEICNYWSNAGKTVKLLGFCKDEGDEAAALRIAEACENKDMLRCVFYNGNTEEFLNEINSCETVYATRFHAMILGWAMQKNVMPIIYSEKQVHVIEDLKFDGEAWDPLSGEPFPEKLFLSHNGRLSPALTEQLKKEAEAQFGGLDSFLSGKTR